MLDIQNVISTTEGCRYCLMCRHVCPVARVTYNEATSPHGWALEIASVRRGLLEWNAETTDLLYQCADCGLCQAFCVTDQPLPDAIVAARAEAVAAGWAPAEVAELDAALRRWGSSYAGPHPPAPSPIAMGEGEILLPAAIGERESLLPSPAATGEGSGVRATGVRATTTGAGESLLPSPAATGEGSGVRATGVRATTALFVGSAAFHREWDNVRAARRLLEHAGVEHTLAAVGRSSGYLAYTLGLHATARDLARATVEELEHLGCRRLVVLSPEHVHTLRHIYPRLGVQLPERIEVIDLTVLLAALLDEGRLKLRQADLDLAYHDPCQTPRIDGRWRAPRRLLAALTTRPPREGFWRERRATPCGASGGLPWTQPDLAAGLARAALADASRDGARLIVTDAPGCLAQLRANVGEGVEVRGLYELLVEHLDTH